MNITEMLDNVIANWETIGHPALLERFVRRNGKEFKAQPFIGHRMEQKQCFMNAAHYSHMMPHYDYVEGFMWREGFPLLIHHAWCTDADNNVIDPTLVDPENCQFFGLMIPQDELNAELIRNGVYGLFDPGRGYNTDLIFQRDPELKELCDAWQR